MGQALVVLAVLACIGLLAFCGAVAWAVWRVFG